MLVACYLFEPRFMYSSRLHYAIYRPLPAQKTSKQRLFVSRDGVIAEQFSHGVEYYRVQSIL